ncbi:hypothetical protein [Miltoncostaea oceani]|jgi:hypothetical protein|uniref:hypothetical protein n=1 Tax=Miltoncostaea oceani TaxID=2843216 RepID=UPI001C3CF7F5|nr:hypothetical protein [Miltoncostaea oceani]
MNGISATQMSALTAMAAALQQQRAVLPLLETMTAPPPAAAPGAGARVDVRA